MEIQRWITNTSFCVAYAIILGYIASQKSNHLKPHRYHPRSLDWNAALQINPKDDDKAKNEDDLLLDFSRSSNSTQRIPHIIHQMWNNRSIPFLFQNWIRKWTLLHPNWEYWFWTLDDVRLLIRSHYPEYLLLYDEYPTMIHKADAARLFVIYHYGGLYIDLDAEPLKPFDDWTFNYNCILTQETEAHPFILRDERIPSVINTVMACKPKHPLFKALLESLQVYYDMYGKDFLRAAGAMYFNDIFRKFNNGSTAVQGLRRGSLITVIPPKYFLPTFDNSQLRVLESKCHPFNIGKLHETGQNVCYSLRRRYFTNPVPSESYMNHHWVHIYMWAEKDIHQGILDADRVIPEAKNVTKMLHEDSSI